MDITILKDASLEAIYTDYTIVLNATAAVLIAVGRWVYKGCGGGQDVRRVRDTKAKG